MKECNDRSIADIFEEDCWKSLKFWPGTDCPLCSFPTLSLSLSIFQCLQFSRIDPFQPGFFLHKFCWLELTGCQFAHQISASEIHIFLSSFRIWSSSVFPHLIYLPKVCFRLLTVWSFLSINLAAFYKGIKKLESLSTVSSTCFCSRKVRCWVTWYCPGPLRYFPPDFQALTQFRR